MSNIPKDDPGISANAEVMWLVVDLIICSIWSRKKSSTNAGRVPKSWLYNRWSLFPRIVARRMSVTVELLDVVMLLKNHSQLGENNEFNGLNWKWYWVALCEGRMITQTGRKWENSNRRSKYGPLFWPTIIMHGWFDLIWFAYWGSRAHLGGRISAK